MDDSKKTLGLEDPDVVVNGNGKTVRKKKKRCWEDREYNEPPFYDEFRPFWGPGSMYKPWIYGNKIV